MLGRKRKPARREPNGKPHRPSLPLRHEDVTSVVREARQRVFGISPALAAAMPETSPLGLLRATGSLSQRQYDAAGAWQAIERQFRSVMLVPGWPEAGNLDRAGGGADGREGNDPDYVRAFQRIVDRHFDCEHALLTAPDRRAWHVTKLAMAIDYDLPNDDLPALQTGLNALAEVLEITA